MLKEGMYSLSQKSTFSWGWGQGVRVMFPKIVWKCFPTFCTRIVTSFHTSKRNHQVSKGFEKLSFSSCFCSSAQLHPLCGLRFKSNWKDYHILYQSFFSPNILVDSKTHFKIASAALMSNIFYSDNSRMFFQLKCTHSKVYSLYKRYYCTTANKTSLKLLYHSPGILQFIASVHCN